MWNNVPKTTTQNYVNVNPAGKAGFNDAGVFFDDPNVFFDGISNTWTDVPKPTGNVSGFSGIASGLMIPLTLKGPSVNGDRWKRIPKPT